VKPIDVSFFDGKRPWSRIKDRVLGSYLPPYLRKTARLGQPIVIVDCFAGRGKFSDGTPGSPLIICQQIKLHAPQQATAHFVNKRRPHHDALSRTLRGFIDTGIAHPTLGQGENVLEDLSARFPNQTLFAYLDPFGIKGCNFAATRRLLERCRTASTEVLMTLSMPVLHRLAAKGSAHAIISRFHRVLDDVLGDIAWREIMFDPRLSAAQKEEQIIAAYCTELRKHIRHACACPVRDADEERVKYYIVFASRHAHALILMNDIMLNAYQDHTFANARERMPLFEGVLDDWRTTRETKRDELALIVTNAIRDSGPIRRADLWERIVIERFMHYTEAEYRNAVQTLVEIRAIDADIPPGRRLNDGTLLRRASKRTPTSATSGTLARRSS
jgi:three-Cys-motif partner protein